MELQETDKGTVINVRVRPNSKQFQAKVEYNELVVFCRASPVKGRANRELTRELSRLFKRRVEIISGFSSRDKRVLVADADVGTVEKVLDSL